MATEWLSLAMETDCDYSKARRRRDGARLRSIQPYARQHGFVGGFHDFQDGQVDGKPTIGVVVIKNSAAVAITIPAEDLR